MKQLRKLAFHNLFELAVVGAVVPFVVERSLPREIQTSRMHHAYIGV